MGDWMPTGTPSRRRLRMNWQMHPRGRMPRRGGEICCHDKRMRERTSSGELTNEEDGMIRS